MRILAVAAALTLAFSSASLAKEQCRDAKGKFMKCPAAAAPKQCKTGKPCGNSCIAKDKVCHKG